MHDTTAVRVEGIDGLLAQYPDVQLLVDAGCQGVARDHRGQVTAPPTTAFGQLTTLSDGAHDR